MVPYIEFYPTSITVHETDLPNVELEQFYKSVKKCKVDLKREPQVSFQFCVGAVTIRQLVNAKRTCWHAGYKIGNNTSIGIEICQYSDNEKQKQAYLNAIELIKVLKSELNMKRVVRHYDCIRKSCPSKLLDKTIKGLTWSWFTSLLEEEKKYTQLENGTYNKEYRVISNTLNVRATRP